MRTMPERSRAVESGVRLGAIPINMIFAYDNSGAKRTYGNKIMTLREEINASDFGASLSEWLIAFIENREEAERERVKQVLKSRFTASSRDIDLVYPPKQEKLPSGGTG